MALCTLTGKIKSLIPLPRQICLLIALVSVLLILSISMLIVIPQFNQELKQLIFSEGECERPALIKNQWKFIK